MTARAFFNRAQRDALQDELHQFADYPLPERVSFAEARRVHAWLHWKRHNLCRDCGVDTVAIGHWYMISDELWAAAKMAPNGGTLCLPCLERRLGRRLMYRDFTAVVPRAWQRHLCFRDATR
jgi:hypothetical protein